MEHTILKLDKSANISTRTLRYYDETRLLKPLKINGPGYRIFGRKKLIDYNKFYFIVN